METKQYLCIDQKSFYATVECVERGLDPMTTDLVVADPERSENTICLAVSPSLKAKGVSNRCRVKEIPKHLKYITAVPRMQLYIDCAAAIHGVFLKYIAPEDIHTYSIDESFLDVTPYLKLYKMTARELAKPSSMMCGRLWTVNKSFAKSPLLHALGSYTIAKRDANITGRIAGRLSFRIKRLPYSLKNKAAFPSHVKCCFKM